MIQTYSSLAEINEEPSCINQFISAFPIGRYKYCTDSLKLNDIGICVYKKLNKWYEAYKNISFTNLLKFKKFGMSSVWIDWAIFEMS